MLQPYLKNSNLLNIWNPFPGHISLAYLQRPPDKNKMFSFKDCSHGHELLCLTVFLLSCVYFLASQDALEVMLVSESVSESVSQSL